MQREKSCMNGCADNKNKSYTRVKRGKKKSYRHIKEQLQLSWHNLRSCCFSVSISCFSFSKQNLAIKLLKGIKC